MHQQPVIIVDPLSSGTELAPAFKARNVPAIAVQLAKTHWTGFGSSVQTDHFMAVIPEQPDLVTMLKKYDPLCILPGTEEAVPLAEQLSVALTPQFANDPQKSLHRQHKGYMQEALKQVGIPFLQTINTAVEAEVEAWIAEQNLGHVPLIVKPPMSAGSDKVFHIQAHQDWRLAFNQVLSEPSQTTGLISETAIVQEQAVGTEFAVGTVSYDGQHSLTHLIKYHKVARNGRDCIYDYVEFVPYQAQTYGEVFNYTQQVLDAVGLRWGASHTEIMLTDNGPRLIELGARMCGGPVVNFSRAATGSSQADRLAEIFVDGAVASEHYHLQQSVVPVFLRSPQQGRVKNLHIFTEAAKCPTFLTQFISYNNGDVIPKTIDYLSSLGIIALAGNRDDIFLDYQKIRDMEAELEVE